MAPLHWSGAIFLGNPGWNFLTMAWPGPGDQDIKAKTSPGKSNIKGAFTIR